MVKIKEFFNNKWVKFTLVSLVWILWFVVWTGNWWMLLGEIVIWDLYISKFFYRAVWSKHKSHKKHSRNYKFWMEWVEAIVFATVAATLIRIFIFEMYVIPTPSMEKSLLVGDYLCVSKVAYGPKMPNTPLTFPFVHNTMPFSQTQKSYSEAIKRPYHRLRGWGSVQRGDVVVFNFPAGDTVLLERQDVTYYDVLREYEARFGAKEGRRMLSQAFTITARPVDKRENYVKRCVGLPGDTLRIVESELLINGSPLNEIPAMQFAYKVQTNGTPIGKAAFEKLGIANDDVWYDQASGIYELPLTRKNADKIAKFGNVTGVVRTAGYRQRVFPHDERYPWDKDDFGPLWIPRKGATVGLTADNLPLYRRIIEIYEGNKLEVREDGSVYINGSQADSYTFQMDYYFMMGDNRDNSLDSRFWGFVPEDHVVGKASFVWFSTDKDKSWPGKIRWSRLFRGPGALQNR